VAAAEVLLIDPTESSLTVLASRLRMQGYAVTECSTAADGARHALLAPPRAVVADLWMPSISGVQLCRLLNAEPSTMGVPVILRGPDAQRNRFWAERAGAAAYVVKGRMGDLVRALSRTIALTPEPDEFFTQLAGDDLDVRDRIAAHLDQALFASVIASEIRALSSCGEFERLFDLFAQFVCRVTSYRWLGISTFHPRRVGLHCNPLRRAAAELEARDALQAPRDVPTAVIEDEDALDDASGASPLVAPIELGTSTIGRLSLAGREASRYQDVTLVTVLARELAGPIRMVALVEESQRLSRLDPLTGLMNRRAFREQLERDIGQAHRHATPLACILFDIDHFKHINDQHGHATGDAVLTAVGELLRRTSRTVDLNCRWGGEEFVVMLHHCDLRCAQDTAENLRTELAHCSVVSENGAQLSVTASFGIAELTCTDTIDTLIDRADRAMYEAKTSGRNRVVAAVAEMAPASIRQASG
jgi:two-component system cell cycle response regulator